MIAPPTVTETNERMKLVLNNLWRSQPSKRSSSNRTGLPRPVISVWERRRERRQRSVHQAAEAWFDALQQK